MKKDRIIALTKTAMRLTFLYVLITSIVVFTSHATEADAQGALDKRIELSGKRTTIKELITMLEEQSGSHFIYSSSAIKTNRKIKIAPLYGELSDVLSEVLRPVGIDYKVEHDKILLFGVVPKFTISVNMTDASNGMPTLGAAVTVQGTGRGTGTDDNGQFSLAVVPNETVEVCYVGFAAQEFVVDSNRHVYD